MCVEKKYWKYCHSFLWTYHLQNATKVVHSFPFIVVFITINNEHFKFICLFFLITFSSEKFCFQSLHKLITRYIDYFFFKSYKNRLEVYVKLCTWNFLIILFWNISRFLHWVQVCSQKCEGCFENKKISFRVYNQIWLKLWIHTSTTTSHTKLGK